MNRPGHQEGMTLISALVTLIGLGIVVLMGLRLVPIYIEAYEVGSILQSMESDSGLRNASRGEVRKTFEKRLNVNDIDFVKDDLKVNEIAGGLQLIVNYQARVHLLGNLDAVASFRKEAMIRD